MSPLVRVRLGLVFLGGAEEAAVVSGLFRVPRVPLSHTPKINLRLPAITAMRKGITSRSVRSPLLEWLGLARLSLQTSLEDRV